MALTIYFVPSAAREQRHPMARELDAADAQHRKRMQRQVIPGPGCSHEAGAL